MAHNTSSVWIKYQKLYHMTQGRPLTSWVISLADVKSFSKGSARGRMTTGPGSSAAVTLACKDAQSPMAAIFKMRHQCLANEQYSYEKWAVHITETPKHALVHYEWHAPLKDSRFLVKWVYIISQQLLIVSWPNLQGIMFD